MMLPIVFGSAARSSAPLLTVAVVRTAVVSIPSVIKPAAAKKRNLTG